MFDVLTIAGSPSGSSRSSAVLEYARRALESYDLHTWPIHVRDLPAEDLLYGRADSAALVERIARLRQARAVIIATPIYKASYSGILKTFLDLLPARALADKLVLPIATGGSPAHMLAIDYALRPVLTALGAQHILQGVYVLDAQIKLGDGAPQLDPTIAERLDGSLHYLVGALTGINTLARATA